MSNKIPAKLRVKLYGKKHPVGSLATCSIRIMNDQTLEFPIKVKEKSIEETKEYHLKKLYELSLKSILETPQLTEPTYEQKAWVIDKIKAPSWTWEVCDTR